MAIKNIILDIGNVLSYFRWQEILHEMMGYEGEAFEKLANCTVRTNMWNEFDRGELSDEEIIKHLVQIDSTQEEGIREFFTHLGDLVVDFPYARPWIKELQAQGYKVYLLSNFGKSSFEQCQERGNLQFVQDVDGKVISYLEKQIKPNKEIYQTLLDRYNLVPEECLFFDDLPANIEGARSCGINGVVFENIDQAKEALLSF